jgi:transposase
MGRRELTDAQWQRLEPLLPPQKPRTGRPNDDHRRILNGILWIHRTGAPWRDLPERYGPVGTVSSRFYRWRRAGLWARVLEALQAEADAAGRIDWDLHFVDSSVIRAHQHAAGARRSGEPSTPTEALGRSRGGFSTKIHVRAEGHGKPVTFQLTGGQRHDSTALEALLDGGAVRRKRGRPRLRPRRVAGDKAFAGRPAREQLRRRRIGAVIPTTQQQKRRKGFDREAYRARNRVERLINRLKQFRRIATRYEKRAANYLAMLHIGAIMLWL